MLYIIDGYNVINASSIFFANTLEGRRNKLFDFINSHRPHGSVNNDIIVVFDCNSKNPYESDGYNRENRGEIEVIFSDGKTIADDIIVQIADDASNPYEIIIVTNDKGIWHRTAPSGAKHEKSEDFIARGLKKGRQTENIEVCNDIKIEINKELKNLWLSKQK
ncbi:MAG: NYN domain-containing protein [Elusimicrobiota bacterium]|jgi:predicted RNA-binding protein with PIN domain|nr:NYN domain-containing protein [Elusimicrobiota bacterium]